MGWGGSGVAVPLNLSPVGVDNTSAAAAACTIHHSADEIYGLLAPQTLLPPRRVLWLARALFAPTRFPSSRREDLLCCFVLCDDRIGL